VDNKNKNSAKYEFNKQCNSKVGNNDTKQMTAVTQQHKQCTSNAIFRRVRITTVSWKSSGYYIFWVCIPTLIYPTWRAHVPCYIVICGFSGLTAFFPHHCINGTICVTTFLNIAHVFAFCVSHSKKHSARYDHKYTHAVVSSATYVILAIF